MSNVTLVLRAGYAMRWSRLRQLLRDLIDPKIDLDIHCTVHKGAEVSIGRYWIVLNKEILWEVPQRVAPDLVQGIPNPIAREVTKVLREYVDTPKEALLSHRFESDRFELIPILLAADRRVGKRRFTELKERYPSIAMRIVIEERMRKGI